MIKKEKYNNYVQQCLNKYQYQFGNGLILDIDILRILKIYKSITNNSNDTYSNCSHMIYCCISDPNISFYSYVERIIQYTKVTGWEICYGFILLSKFIKIKRLNFQKCMKFKLFLISIYIAHKFCSDIHYNANHWSKCSGIPIKELNDMEINFLKVIDYRCYIQPSEIVSLFVITDTIGNLEFSKELIKNEKERIQNVEYFEMPHTSLIKTFKNYQGPYDKGFDSYENIQKLVKICDKDDDTNIYII